MIGNTAQRYGSVARVLHWLTALLILANIGLGLVAVRLPVDAMEAKFRLFSLHKTLGIAALAVALIRIAWALGQPRPLPLHPQRRPETLAAQTVHWVLYAAMILVPVAGWVEHAATSGYAPILWGLGQGLPLVPQSPRLAETMASLHGLLAWMLMAAIALHVAGAIKHAVIDRDATLARMLRGRVAGPAAATVDVRGHRIAALSAAAVLAAVIALGLVARPVEPVAGSVATAPATASPPPAAFPWQVTEGRLGLSVRQMGTEVSGSFSDWTALIDFDPATGTGRVTVTIRLESLTLGSVTEQAKAAAFLNATGHPVATFTAEIRPEGSGHVARGQLSLKGRSAPLDLPFALTVTDGVASMSGQTVLDRRDWTVGEGYDTESSVGFPVVVTVSLTAHR